MKVEELRIGNYFYVEKSSCLFDKGTQKVKFDTFNNIRLYNALKSMKPIELTEEILSKIKGSITRVNPLETEIDLGLLYWFSSLPKSVFITTNGFKDIEISCDYLHQLQNLYFALTNEELQINL